MSVACYSTYLSGRVFLTIDVLRLPAKIIMGVPRGRDRCYF